MQRPHRDHAYRRRVRCWRTEQSAPQQVWRIENEGLRVAGVGHAAVSERIPQREFAGVQTRVDEIGQRTVVAKDIVAPGDLRRVRGEHKGKGQRHGAAEHEGDKQKDGDGPYRTATSRSRFL